MSRKVLVVDDERANRELVGVVAEDMGWEILHAASNLEGWEQFLENTDVAAIFMDGKVQDGETVELVLRICSYGYSGTIVAMSSDAELQNRLVRAGCTRELKKERGIVSAIEGILRDLS